MIKSIKKISLKDIIISFHNPVFLILSLASVIIPLAISGYFIYNKIDKLRDKENRLKMIESSLNANFNKEKKLAEFKRLFGKSDHFYLEKNIEPIIFLKDEILILEEILKHPAFEESKSLKKRLNYLKNENRIKFKEEARKASAFFTEIEEKFQNSIELGSQDLYKILALTEGKYPLKPQIIIKDFELSRKNLEQNRETYQVNMSIVKREITYHE